EPEKPKVPTSYHNGMSNQGLATLIVMCCVLGIIVMFCCLAAPGIRDLCKRYVFRQCVIDDPEVDNGKSLACSISEIRYEKNYLSENVLGIDNCELI
ncbi:hypothetical protein HHI36_000666, partial [Cryptolaemus montrouzieri]